MGNKDKRYVVVWHSIANSGNNRHAMGMSPVYDSKELAGQWAQESIDEEIDIEKAWHDPEITKDAHIEIHAPLRDCDKNCTSHEACEFLKDGYIIGTHIGPSVVYYSILGLV